MEADEDLYYGLGITIGGVLQQPSFLWLALKTQAPETSRIEEKKHPNNLCVYKSIQKNRIPKELLHRWNNLFF